MKNPAITKVINEVSDYFNCDYDRVMSKSQDAELVKVRTFCCHFFGEFLGYKHWQSAKIFDRNRSTVSVLLKNLQYELKYNRVLSEQFLEIRELIDPIFNDNDDLIDREVRYILDLVSGKSFQPIEEVEE